MIKNKIKLNVSLLAFMKIIKLPEKKVVKYLDSLTININEFMPSLNIHEQNLKADLNFAILPDLQKLKD